MSVFVHDCASLHLQPHLCCSYKGQFLDGILHGQGVYEYARGGRYEGQFVDGKFQGHGKLDFQNGDRYVGEFKDGKIHGVGERKFAATGNKYSGEWDMGKMHGHGRYYMAASGEIEEGEWVRGKVLRKSPSAREKAAFAAARVEGATDSPTKEVDTPPKKDKSPW